MQTELPVSLPASCNLPYKETGSDGSDMRNRPFTTEEHPDPYKNAYLGVASSGILWDESRTSGAGVLGGAGAASQRPGLRCLGTRRKARRQVRLEGRRTGEPVSAPHLHGSAASPSTCSWPLSRVSPGQAASFYFRHPQVVCQKDIMRFV